MSAAAKMKRRLLIIDTDAGIDDAMALCMAFDAHARGDIEVAAVTCVTGNTHVDNVLVNVLRITDLMGCGDIPVFRGSEEPLVHKYDGGGSYFHGKDGFNDVPFDDKPDVSKRVAEENAVDALRRIVRENPGHVSLVALGPLTNLALAFRTEPSLSGLLQGVFIMGGNSEGIGNASVAAEFNFHADPEAAHVVIETARCPVTIVPWETCYKYTQVTMDWRLNQLGRLDTVAAMMFNKLEARWFTKNEYAKSYVMCDQIAMLVALDGDKAVLKQSEHSASVEVAGSLTRGLLVLDRRDFLESDAQQRKNVCIVDRVDEDKLRIRIAAAFKNCGVGAVGDMKKTESQSC